MWKMFKLVCWKQLHGQTKIKQREVGVGEGIHWKWDATLEIENSCQNKVS